jgi:hypothetical protein
MWSVSVSQLDCDKLCLWLARTLVRNLQPRALRLPSRVEGNSRVVVGRVGELLSDVFQCLTEQGFLGCPVVDEDCNFVGQIDVLDMTAFVCNLFTSRQPTANTKLVLSNSRRPVDSHSHRSALLIFWPNLCLALCVVCCCFPQSMTRIRSNAGVRVTRGCGVNCFGWTDLRQLE